MRGPGSSPARVRRRVDGAIDARRTASHDPRIPTKRPSRGILPPRRFSFDWRSVKKTCRGQVFSAAPAELISAGGNHAGAVNGGGSSAGIPRPPAGQWQRSRYATAPGPLIHPSVRAVHLPPRGGRLSCEGLKRHFRQRRRLIPVCPAGRAKKQKTAPRRRRKKISLPENKCRRLRL